MTEDTGWPPAEPDETQADVPAPVEDAPAEPVADAETGPEPAPEPEEPAPAEPVTDAPSAPEEPAVEEPAPEDDPLFTDVPPLPGLRKALGEILRRIRELESRAHGG